MAEPTINDVMSAYAEDAVEFAKANFAVTLDYAQTSIEDLESIAETLYQSRPKGFFSKLFKMGPSNDEVQTVCKMLGGYLGEVFRRIKGGEWAVHEELSVVGIQRGESWIFPPNQVHHRLTLGDRENLWIYFRLILAEPWGKRDPARPRGSAASGLIPAVQARGEGAATTLRIPPSGS